MDRITIDVARTRGSRSAAVRVHVAPTPGTAGSSFRTGPIDLGPELRLDVELASHIASSVEQAIEYYRRMIESGAWGHQPELP